MKYNQNIFSYIAAMYDIVAFIKLFALYHIKGCRDKA